MDVHHTHIPSPSLSSQICLLGRSPVKPDQDNKPVLTSLSLAYPGRKLGPLGPLSVSLQLPCPSGLQLGASSPAFASARKSKQATNNTRTKKRIELASRYWQGCGGHWLARAGRTARMGENQAIEWKSSTRQILPAPERARESEVRRNEFQTKRQKVKQWNQRALPLVG